MKIALINGQNHKGSTYHIGRSLAEKLGGNDDISEVFLPRDMPNFCCGCVRCIMEDERKCPHYSYMEPITKILDSADLLIFTTPVYVFHASGSMKALLDHYAYRWMVHRPEEKMFSKQAVCISTAAGAGMKSACKDIKDSLSFWGVAKIYRYGIAVAAASWDNVSENKKAKIEIKVEKLSKTISKNNGKVHPPIKTKIIFAFIRKFNKKPTNPADGGYWKAKGWMETKRPWNKA